MVKTDLVKLYRSYYSAKRKPEITAIEKAQYLSIKGKGDPDSTTYADHVQALYATAYTLKLIYKLQDKDFGVAKLEGSWWFDENNYKNIRMEDAPLQIPRSEWEYRMMIRLPDFATQEMLQQAIEMVIRKKHLIPAGQIEMYHTDAHLVVQMLHTGPFDKEPKTLHTMHDFIQANRLEKNGTHHEIYLSDYRKVSPEKLRTILREPVKQTT